MQTQIQENTQEKAQINELPLLELFTRLRQAGLPLGTSEYQLMLQALRAGHGLPDKAALARLCQTLWVKSEEDQIVFNYHFEEVMAQDEQIFESAIAAESVSDLESSAPRQHPVVSRLKKISWPTRIAIGGTIAASIAIAVWSTITLTEQECHISISSPPNLVGREERDNHTVEVQACEGSSEQNLAFIIRFMRQWLNQFLNDYPELLLTGLILYGVARWLLRRYPKPVEIPSLSESIENMPSAVTTLNKALEDEMQIVQTTKTSSLPDAEHSLAALNETLDYFPVTRRQMKQSWRSLRRMVRQGPPVELDVTATMEQTCREGMLLELVLRPRRINRNELLLLIDQDGSMVPFHALSERLAETALQGGQLARTGIYYFHNCPVDYLYRDPYHQEAESINDVIGQLPAEYTSVLIFSDGGAARGNFNQERLDLTAAFLDQLRQQLRYVAWLNPMPRNRWTGTAGEIAKLLPMFELSRHGLDQSIDVLRGKSVHRQAGEMP